MKKLKSKIFRFFFPKDWKGELRKGIKIGKQSGQSLGGVMFDLGKKARKVVDPEHKMKLGKKK